MVHSLCVEALDIPVQMNHYPFPAPETKIILKHKSVKIKIIKTSRRKEEEFFCIFVIYKYLYVGYKSMDHMRKIITIN